MHFIKSPPTFFRIASFIPHRNTVFVIAVLGMVIVAWTLNSLRHLEAINSDMHLVASIVSKDLNPALYPRDFFFGDDTIYRFNTPSFRWLLGQFWIISGSFELGLVWLTVPVLALYLCGMFILLYQVTKNSWLSLGITVASATYQFSLGQEIWGVAGSSHLLARTLFTAVTPFLFLLLLSFIKSPDLLKGGVFGLGVGLAVNLHPGSGLHFTMLIVSLLLLLGVHDRTWRFGIAIAMTIIGIILSSLPFALFFTQNTGHSSSPELSFPQLVDLLNEHYPLPFSPAEIEWPLFGIVLSQSTLVVLVWLYLGLGLAALGVYFWGRHVWPESVRWIWLIGGLLTLWYAHLTTLFSLPLLFLCVGIYMLFRFWQRTISHLDWILLTFMGLVVLYSFVGFYLIISIWQTFELWPLTTFALQQIRAARFIYIPLYLMAGLSGLVLAEGLRVGLKKLFNRSIDEAAFYPAIGLMFALSPLFSSGATATQWLVGGVIITFVGLIGFIVIQLPSNSNLSRWVMPLAIIIVAIILFGPLAPLAAAYSPIPTVNILEAESMSPEQIWYEKDTSLYHWVRQNTSSDALFYWCGFGPITTLNFRRQSQRSVTHGWEELSMIAFDLSTFVPSLDSYRQLEDACNSIDSLVATAHELEADYLLISSSKGEAFINKSCFANDRYIVFDLVNGNCGP